MKLEKTTFDKLEIGDELLFRNSAGFVLHCVKTEENKIRVCLDNKYFVTGQLHEVYKILDGSFAFNKDRKRK